MSTEVDNNNMFITDVFTPELNTELSISRSLAKALSIYSFVKEFEGEDEDLRSVVEHYLNEWVNMIGSLPYKPDLLELLDEIKGKANDLFRLIDEEELSYLLAETIEVKKELDSGDPQIPQAYLTEIKEILRGLGINELSDGDLESIKELVSLFILSINSITFK
ncbi:MAG: hypothetical protein OWQ54_01735 [Sulfolobaceae archaeon]|nr:hypothetical protein [Sulfolobaceae archaeon]